MNSAPKDKLSAAKLALMRQLLSQRPSAVPQPSDTGHRPVTWASRRPASAAQQRLWFIDHLDGPNPTYNVPFYLRMSGSLDVGALWGALDDLVARHESLRTTLSSTGEQVVQVIAEPGPVPRDEAHLTRTDPMLREQAALDLMQAAARQPFSLEEGPLFRATLIRLGRVLAREEHQDPRSAAASSGTVSYLVVVLNHVITDGWSERILFHELGLLYSARAKAWPAESTPRPLEMQYADYADWETRPETIAEYATQLEYWRGHLAHVPESASVPADRLRPLEPTGAGDSVPVSIGSDLLEKLSRWTSARETSLFSGSLCALAALIHRYSGTDLVVIGAPAANRARPEFEPIIGYFANTLAICIDVSGNPSFAELLSRVHAASLGALAHQNVPFDRVVDGIGARREPGMNPVFQIMCSVNQRVAAPQMHGLRTSLTEARNETAKFDLELAVSYESGSVKFDLDYATELFDAGTVQRLARDYATLIEAVLRQPGLAVDGIALEGPARAGEGQAPVGSVYPLDDPAKSPAGVKSPAGSDDGTLSAPAPETESRLAEIWADVLGYPVDRRLDFFQSGGDSLLATKVIARLRRLWPVKLTVRHLLQFPVLADLAAHIDQVTGHAPAAAEPRPRQRPDVIPLTTAQRGIWILNQIEGQQGFYHMPVATRLSGPLDRKALAQALADITERHESLRTVFPFEGSAGAVHQLVLPPAAVKPDLPVQQVAAAQLGQALIEAAQLPFDLTAQAPLRARLFELGPREHILLLVLHHIASDGLSLQPVCEDLAVAYAARLDGHEPPWEPLPLQFADYVLWKAEQQGSEADPASPAARQLTFWLRELAGLPDELHLPGSGLRPPRAAYQGARVPIRIPAETHQAAEELMRTAGVSLFMILQAALATLLTRLGAATDLPIGTPVANRGEASLERLVGCFINTIVLRTNTAGDPTFRELLLRVRDGNLPAYAHADLPFDRVVEQLNPERVPGRNPLFQVLLSLIGAPEPAPQLRDLGAEPVDVGLAVDPFDLMVEVTELRTPSGGPGGLSGHVHYNQAIFGPQLAGCLAALLKHLLESASTAPERRLSEFVLRTEDPRERAMQDQGIPAARLGIPVPDLAVYVVDDAGQSAVPGFSGEVSFVGSREAIAAATTHWPALAEATASPFHFGRPEQYMIRSGRRGRWNADAGILLGARVDRCASIGGTWVDPGEIEAVLVRNRLAAAALVLPVAAESPAADARLVAYVVRGSQSSDWAAETVAAALHEFATIHLPSNLVPEKFVVVDTIAVAADGTVDYSLLPSPTEEKSDGTATASLTPTEERVTEIIATVLGTEKVDARANFFVLGGHSLLATRVVMRTRAEFQLSIPLSAFFENPTAVDFAARVDEIARVDGTRSDAGPGPAL